MKGHAGGGKAYHACLCLKLEFVFPFCVLSAGKPANQERRGELNDRYDIELFG